MRIPRKQVLSTNSVAWIKSCLGKCDAEHEHSHISRNKRFVPTRLLDLRNDPVKLVECHTDSVRSVDQLPKYAAVSYCWGSPKDAAQQIRTDIGTLQSRLSGIQGNEMTPLLRDVIKTAVKLSVPYLWIDSLCIIQDDPVDWGKESIVMDRVYGNAYVTLCPLSSQSCHQGFLRRDFPRLPIPFISSRYPEYSGFYEVRFRRALIGGRGVDTPSGSNPFTEDIKSSKWIRRGWTFQEAALSTRMIFFGATSIHFLCPTWQRTECQQEPPNHISRTRRGDRLSTLEYGHGFIQIRALSHGENSIPYLYEAWKQMVSVYSKRLFTNALDTLPALSGMAAYFQSHLPVEDEYIFGSWKLRFSEHLLWNCSASSTNHPRYLDELLSQLKSRTRGAPSWSWASRHHISFNHFAHFAREYEVTETHDETRSLQFDNHVHKSFNGTIQITTNVRRLSSILHMVTLTLLPDTQRFDLRVDNKGYLAGCFIDYGSPEDDCENMSMVLLRSKYLPYKVKDRTPRASRLFAGDIAASESIGTATLGVAYGLIIYPAEERDTYYRIGSFISLPFEEGGLDSFKQQPVETVTII